MKTRLSLMVFFTCLTLAYQTKAQLVINGSYTTTQLIQNILVGGGVTITNVTYTGQAGQVAAFTGGSTTNLGLDQGIVLSTGTASQIPGSNTYFQSNSLGGAGDATLTAMANGTSSHDACVLQFDFIPLSNVVNFRYVFGSEEYPEYVCSSYNDVFGFFVTGPNPSGGSYSSSNVALIPSTTYPVMINSVNSGSTGSYGTVSNCTPPNGSLAYSQYYVNNTGTTICYDGFTTPLTATINVVPCQTYHIKLAIADVGDGAFDSGVFLEANSFTADAINLLSTYTNSGLGNVAYEGCSDGTIYFTLNDVSNLDTWVHYSIAGTATNGVDYNQIPDSVLIPAGQLSASLTIHPIMDGITEGNETVVLHVQTSPCGTQDVSVTIADNTPVVVQTSPDQTICDGQQPVTFTVASSGGVAPLSLQWSNGLGTANSVSISPTLGSHIYYVTATDACGASSSDQISITVNATPTSAFTASSPICPGNPSSIIYTGTAQSGAIYAWAFNGATILTGTQPGPGPYGITWNTAGSYSVSLSVQSAQGCQSTVTTQYVQVVGAGTPMCCLKPTPDAGTNHTFCGLEGQFNAALPADPSYVGTWTQISGPSGGVSTISDVHSTYSSLIVNVEGTYTYQWHEVNGPCDSSDNVTLVFIGIPIANAGHDSSVCGKTYHMTATLQSGSTGIWSGTGIQTPASQTSTVTVQNYGTYGYSWTVTHNGCQSTDSVYVTFLELPVTSAGPDINACGVRATLNADIAFPGYWSGPSGVIYVDGYTNPLTSVIVPNYTGATYSATFTWHAHNAICSDVDNANVTFRRPPHVEAGPSQSICGVHTTLAPDTIGSSIVSAYWYSVPTGPVLTPGPTSDPYSYQVDITNMGSSAYHFSVGEFLLIMVAQNGVGCADADTVKITFYDTPVAYAGLDTAICGKTYNLNGHWSLTNPVGIWSQETSNPGVANFTPPINPVSTVTVSEYGNYTFVWKESNAGNTTCLDRDTIHVNFRTIPTPDAGNDFSVCGNFAYVCATQSPGINGGQWSSPYAAIAYYDGDNGNYTPANQHVPCTWVRHVAANDTITMYWSEFNGVCSGIDSVKVLFSTISPAVQLVDPSDSLVCGPFYNRLNAQWPQLGTGHWIDTVFSTTFSPSASITSATATIYTGNDSYYGWHHFYWVTNNGSCSDTSSLVKVKFIKYPTPDAGGHYWAGLFGANSHIKTDTVCGLNYQMAPHQTVGTGTWYTTQMLSQFAATHSTTSNVYNDSLTLNCVNCFSVFSSGNQYYPYIWTENNQGCIKSDTLRLYFAPNPSGQFSTTVPACRHFPYASRLKARTWAQANDIDYGLTNFQWEYPGGTLMATTADAPVLNVGWQSGENHVVRLITYNRWNCHSGVYTGTVTEPPKFSPTTTLIPTTCMQNNGEITMSSLYSGNSNYFTFEWWPHSAYANYSSASQSNLAPLSVDSVVVHGQTLSPDTFGIVCHDTLVYTVRDTGEIKAIFDTTLFSQHEAAPYQVQFYNLTLNGRKYSWRIFNEDDIMVYTTTSPNPTYVFDKAGCYKIVLVATSKAGCIDTMSYTFLCVDANPVLEAPNVFTPNNDGQNDIFRVHGESISEFHCIIYNRWGKKVYEWNDINGYWDGKIGGSEAAPGVYYYKLTATDKKGKQYDQNSYFYLLRDK